MKNNRRLNSIYIITTFVFVFIIRESSFAQTKGSVGIGTYTPNSSAILDVSSDSKGVLLPRMTQKNRENISSPEKGLIVYQTDNSSGLYIYNGKSWGQISNNNTSQNLLSSSAIATAASTTWNTNGNSNLDFEKDFLGTIDTSALQFKVNNVPSGIIDFKRSNTIFGYSAGRNNSGYNSVIIGALALQRASKGANNVSIGFQSMFENTKGNYNVALGASALTNNIVGNKNVSLGALSGFNSVGSGNIFIGYQAGYFEANDNRLVISNSAYNTPLLYGDLDRNYLSINSEVLGYPLSINSGKRNSTGLHFQNLTSNSPAMVSSGKVLSVNDLGEVILVEDQNTVSTSNWSLSSNQISNTNSGNVNITSGLTVNGQTKTNNLTIDGQMVFSNLKSSSPSTSGNGKALSVDQNGKVILVNSSTTTPPSSGGSGLWVEYGDHNEMVNNKKVSIGPGIGSLPGDYALYVSKGILTERLRVSLQGSEKWADYVFKENYPLMPLNQVEEYVKLNKHLPNVPSAEEIDKQGIDMVEMNAKLMEKIEELTLYMIQADKTINKLSEKIDELSNQK